MKMFFKNNAKVFGLAILTIVMGVLVFTSENFVTLEKTTETNNNDDKKGYNYTSSIDEYYYEDEYNYVNDGEYEYYYDELYDDYNEYDEYDYNYNYKYNNNYNYDDSNSLYNYVSTKVTTPYVEYSSSKNLNLFEEFDPYSLITTNGVVTVLYNDVDNTKVGNYTVSYSVCNKQSSAVCRYVNIMVMVRDWDNRYENYDEYNTDKTASVRWDDVEVKRCEVGSSRCLARNIDLPTATDPYDGSRLNVRVVSNNIDINEAGYYYITYSATTKYGVTSSTVRQVQIKDSDNMYQSNSYNGNIKTKQINNHEWTNVVTYSYKCINPNNTGASAWEYAGKLTNDDHATYYYNQNGYTGILNKVSFYEVNPYQGDIREQLGTCSTYGQLKTLTRTWVGVYSGTVTNYNY